MQIYQLPCDYRQVGKREVLLTQPNDVMAADDLEMNLALEKS